MVLLLLGGLKAYSVRYQEKGTMLLAEATQLPAGQRVVGYQGLVKKYPRSEAANLARLYLGYEALHQKKYDEAIGWYLPVSQSAADPMLRVSALQNLALAWREKGDPQRAIDYLTKASKDSDNATQDYTQLLLANLYADSGQTEKAKEIYKILAESGELVKAEAAKRLLWLEPTEKK